MMICIHFKLEIKSQTTRNYSIEISCKSRTLDSTRSILEFKWPKRTPTTTAYYLYKKGKDRYDWGASFRTLASADSSFNDTILTGTAYEYMVEKYFGPDGYPTYGFIYAGHRLPAKTDRGKILLIADSTHKTFLTNAIRTYRNDLIGDGWQTELKWFSPLTTVSEIKSYIVSMYNADPANVKSIVLIGDLAVPYSGDFSKNTAYWPPDGHVSISGYGPSHEGAWPTDIYYGSINNTPWTDASVNNTDGVRPANRNVPSDGKFDVTVLQELVTLEVGRIDLSGMTAFKYNVPDSGNVERELLMRYFTKNHDFRHKNVDIKERCLVDDNIGLLTGGTYNEQFAGNAYRNMSALISDSVTKNNTSIYDYRTTLKTNDYLWSFGFGTGSYVNCSNVASTVQLADTAQYIKSVFSGFMGSFFGDWDTSNNLLRAPLAAKGNVLNTFWCGRPNWYFHHMGLGETIGYSTIRTQNNYDSFWSALYGQALALYPNMAYFPFEIHPSLMGDPSVRMQPVYPASNFTAVQDSCNTQKFKLTWTTSTDTAVHTYYIYRSKHIDSAFQLLATTSQTIYRDNSPLTGTNVYMVRASKLQTSGSGTYFNLSQGLFDTISTASYRTPLVNAGNDTLVCRNQVVKIGENVNNSFATTYLWTPGNYATDTVSISVTANLNHIVTVTDVETGCNKMDTVSLSTIALPVSETISASTQTCSDTVGWSSTNNNGINYEYSWTFPSGSIIDTSGFGLVSPGTITYGSTGSFTAGLIVRDTASGCSNGFIGNVDILCVGLSVNWADLKCNKLGESTEISFNIIDYQQIESVVIEGLSLENQYIKIGELKITKDGRYNYIIENSSNYRGIRISSRKIDGNLEELDICIWSSEKGQILVYPNPVESIFKVVFEDAFLNINSSVVIYNSMGIEMFNFNHNFENGELEINCEDWLKGIYTIVIQNEKSVKTTQFIR